MAHYFDTIIMLERDSEMKLVNGRKPTSFALSNTPGFRIKRQSQPFRATDRSNSNFQKRAGELIMTAEGKATGTYVVQGGSRLLPNDQLVKRQNISRIKEEQKAAPAGFMGKKSATKMMNIDMKFKSDSKTVQQKQVEMLEQLNEKKLKYEIA